MDPSLIVFSIAAAALLSFLVALCVIASGCCRSLPLGNILRQPRFRDADIPDLTGKTALVTGASSGLGRSTAIKLAIHGAHVILACRSELKGLQVLDDIKKAKRNVRRSNLSSSGKCEVVQIDLSSLQSVKHCADMVRKLCVKRGEGQLDILILNAGRSAPAKPIVSSDGIETTFQENYLGHFYLTKRLLSLVQRAKGGRIVHLSSSAHRFAPKQGVFLTQRAHNSFQTYGRIERYAMAKLANLVFAKELQRRIDKFATAAAAASDAEGGHDEHRIFSNACHPGIVATHITRGAEDGFPTMLQPFIRGAIDFRNRCFAYDPEAACLTVLYLATSNEVETNGIRGEYFVPIAELEHPAHKLAFSPAFGSALWEFSENLCARAMEKKHGH